jgi:hypothetical protein
MARSKTDSAPGGVPDNVTVVNFRRVGADPAAGVALADVLAEVEAQRALVAKRKELFPTLKDKLFYLQTHLPTLGKDQRNESDGWSYTSIASIVNTLRPYQEALGLLIQFKPVIGATKESRMRVRLPRGGYAEALRVKTTMRMEITDIDTKEVEVFEVEADAFDDAGKSLNQSYTLGRRNNILTTFNLVTSDDVANENDRHSLRVAGGETDLAPLAADDATNAVADVARHEGTSRASGADAPSDTVAAEDPPPDADDGDAPIQERATLVGEMIDTGKRKGKTLVEVVSGLRKICGDPRLSLETASPEQLLAALTKLRALPDHSIPFQHAS